MRICVVINLVQNKKYKYLQSYLKSDMGIEFLALKILNKNVKALQKKIELFGKLNLQKIKNNFNLLKKITKSGKDCIPFKKQVLNLPN